MIVTILLLLPLLIVVITITIISIQYCYNQVCLPLRAALIWTKSKAVVVRIAIFSILNEANLLVLKLTFSSFLVLSMLHTHTRTHTCARTHARTHDNVNDTHIMEMMIISGVSCQLDLYLCLYPYFI